MGVVDLWKTESRSTSETSDLPVFSAAPFQSTHRQKFIEKFIDRGPHWFTRRVKVAIHIKLHRNNVNKDRRIEIPEAWIKKHNNRTVRQQTTEGTMHRNNEDRNTLNTAVENQPITARHRVIIRLLNKVTHNQSTLSPDKVIVQITLKK